MNSMFLATYTSRKFEFEGVGKTAASSFHALVAALKRHRKQYGTEKFWDEDEFVLRELKAGCGYRDREPI